MSGEKKTKVLPFEEMRGHGVLWLINAVVFHPRGYALYFAYEDGQLVGWYIKGDGKEPWYYKGTEGLDTNFAAVEALLAQVREENA